MQEAVNEVLRSSKFPNVRVAKDEESKERVAQLAEIYREEAPTADATNSDEEFDFAMRRNAIAEYLSLTVPSAEEWAIHDYDDEDGIFEGLGEYPGLAKVAARVELLEKATDELGDDGKEIVFEYWDHVGCMPDDADDAVERARDAYAGQFNTWEDWATEYLESTGALESIPENLRNYFDFAAYGRDAECGGDLFKTDSGHFFYSR
jgi:antirestriction protein